MKGSFRYVLRVKCFLIHLLMGWGNTAERHVKFNGFNRRGQGQICETSESVTRVRNGPHACFHSKSVPGSEILLIPRNISALWVFCTLKGTLFEHSGIVGIHECTRFPPVFLQNGKIPKLICAVSVLFWLCFFCNSSQFLENSSASSTAVRSDTVSMSASRIGSLTGRRVDRTRRPSAWLGRVR